MFLFYFPGKCFRKHLFISSIVFYLLRVKSLRSDSSSDRVPLKRLSMTRFSCFIFFLKIVFCLLSISARQAEKLTSSTLWC